MTEFEHDYERLDEELHQDGSYEVLAGILLCLALAFGAWYIFF